MSRPYKLELEEIGILCDDCNVLKTEIGTQTEPWGEDNGCRSFLQMYSIWVPSSIWRTFKEQDSISYKSRLVPALSKNMRTSISRVTLYALPLLYCNSSRIKPYRKSIHAKGTSDFIIQLRMRCLFGQTTFCRLSSSTFLLTSLPTSTFLQQSLNAPHFYRPAWIWAPPD